MSLTLHLVNHILSLKFHFLYLTFYSPLADVDVFYEVVGIGYINFHMKICIWIANYVIMLYNHTENSLS